MSNIIGNKTKAMVVGAGAIMILAALLVMVQPAAGYNENDKYSADLYAGQNILVGRVDVWNDGLSTLYVEFVLTASNWYLEETQVDYGPAVSDIPQNNGNPVPGQFDYKTTHTSSNMVTSYQYEIDLTADGWDWAWGWHIYIATHATVHKIVDGTYTQGETAWSGDNDFDGANWATYIDFPMIPPNGGEDPGDMSSETAWGGTWDDTDSDNYVDRNEDMYNPYYSQTKGDRGNWALFIEYSVGDTTTVDLIAGQHWDVGDVIITSDANGYVTVEIDISGDWEMSEYHIHIEDDNDYRPLQEPKPGQFDYKGSWETMVTDVEVESDEAWSGDLYIMVHVVVWS